MRLQEVYQTGRQGSHCKMPPVWKSNPNLNHGLGMAFHGAFYVRWSIRARMSDEISYLGMYGTGCHITLSLILE